METEEYEKNMRVLKMKKEKIYWGKTERNEEEKCKEKGNGNQGERERLCVCVCGGEHYLEENYVTV